MASASPRNHMCVQPRSQQALGVLAGSPWGTGFEQERDDRLDGDYVDDVVVAAEPLIDQAGKPLQAAGVIGKQAGPRVSEHTARIRECDQGLTGYVPPASTVTSFDDRIERSL